MRPPRCTSPPTPLDRDEPRRAVPQRADHDPARPSRCHSVVPNCIAKPKGEKRSYVCDEIHGIKDVSSLNLRRPIDRGYVVNWDLQKDIWHHVFSKLLKVDPKKCHLVLTEAPFNLPAVATAQDEAVFKHFGFKSCVTCAPAGLVMTETLGRARDAREGRADDEDATRMRMKKIAADARCGVVVDVGFSFAHVTPVFDGRVVRAAVRRVNLGGKALTNFLKELVSYRQWNMMDEYFLVDDVKEKLCYVAADADSFQAELRRARVRGPSNEVNREYVLPDGVHVTRGYVKAGPARDPDEDEDEDEDDPDEGGTRKKARGGGDGNKKKRRANGVSGPGVKVSHPNHQTLGMGNERFMVPEALFHPSDVGLAQAGVAEATARAVEAVKRDARLRGLFYANVVLCGGCAALPGFARRFECELRQFVDAGDELNVSVAADGDPVGAAWRGGSRMGASDEFERTALTREAYLADPAAVVEKLERNAPVIPGRA